jgi:hypothetical protein
VVFIGLALCVRRGLEKRVIYLCTSSLHKMVVQFNEKEKKLTKMMPFFVFI